MSKSQGVVGVFGITEKRRTRKGAEQKHSRRPWKKKKSIVTSSGVYKNHKLAQSTKHSLISSLYPFLIPASLV